MLSLAASIVCFSLGVIVYSLNRKATLNRVFALAVLTGGYWALTEYLTRTALTTEAAYFWNRASFIWPFFSAFLIHFTLVFTENSFLKKRRNYLLLYGPPLVFSIVGLFTEEIVGTITYAFWGYTYNCSLSWISILCNVWSGVVAYSAILLCVLYYVRVTDTLKRKQAKFVTIGLAVPVLTFSVTEVLFPAFGMKVPELGNTFSAFMSIFVAYAIWKYRLFQLGPEIAAETILRTMPDSLILADINRTILRANASLTNLLGYTEKELKGKPIKMLFPSEEQYDAAIAEFIRTEDVRNHEITLKTKTGEERIVSVSGSFVRNKKGKPLGVICVIHDLTPQKEIEQKLVNAQRFALIGELAGMVGHDLRNPLTSIQGATFYLKRKYGPQMDAGGQEMLSTIERSIQYSNKIVKDLSDFSGVIRLELTTTTPKALLTNALELLSVPQEVTLVDLTCETTLEVDSSHMCRVFVNILKNALDAMPNGGTLTVKTCQTEDFLEISFSDTGVGMTAETLRRIWTLLFTTKPKGMGFGLPICKRIAEAHGGTISATSIQGKGTTITLTLPLAPRQPIPDGVRGD